MQRVFMNTMTRVRLDHLAQLQIASNRAQLHVSEPLPRRALFFQIIKKSISASNEWSILPVRPQTQVDAIEIPFTRDARKRRDHQLHQTRVSLVLRESLDRRRHHRVVREEHVEIRTVIDTGAAEPAETIHRDAGPTTERTIPSRHFTTRDQV